MERRPKLSRRWANAQVSGVTPGVTANGMLIAVSNFKIMARSSAGKRCRLKFLKRAAWADGDDQRQTMCDENLVAAEIYRCMCEPGIHGTPIS